MSFNISKFTEALSSGGARPTLFKVKLNSPFTSGLNNLSSVLVEASSLPSSTIGPIELPYMGRKIRFAGDRTFDTWDVTVINDENFKIRQAMELWHNRINALQENISTTNPGVYKVDAQVEQFAKNNATVPIRTYKYHGMFPIEISPIDLNWNSTDEVERFTVRFSYDWYDVVGTTSDGGII
jgi:hypothetical protein